MRCDVCGKDVYNYSESDGKYYCYQCIENTELCGICGNRVNRDRKLSIINKLACDPCFNRISKIRKDPKIGKLLSMKLSELIAETSSVYDDFESIGNEALNSALKIQKYNIIGVNPNASLNEIKDKCKELMQEWHPDLHKNNQEKYNQAVNKVADLKKAYEAIVAEKNEPYLLLELKYGVTLKECRQAYDRLKEIYNPAYFIDDVTLHKKVKFKRDEITKAYENIEMLLQINNKTAPTTQKPPTQQKPISISEPINSKPSTQTNSVKTEPTGHSQNNRPNPNNFQNKGTDNVFQNKKSSDSSSKPKGFSWKILLSAFFIAVFLNAGISVATGVEPRKNITWTVFWIYLTIDGWKYLHWKALLPYPLFIVINSVLYAVMANSSEDSIWFFIGLLLVLNIGGLFAFSSYISKAKQNQY